LASIQESIGLAPAAAPAAAAEEDVEMQGEEQVLPADVEAKIVETHQA